MKKQVWHVIYYEHKDGACPIYKFLESRTDREKAKLFNWIALLEREGPQLPRPYADFLEDGIHELRIKLSGDQVRVLYFFCYHDFIVLTHCFTKHTAKVPVTEIETAKKCRMDFLKRYTEKKIREQIDEDL
ncbi:MAG: type II toxin-antitoxin system RelE/ParE family toxin [Chitinivibrionales bacterium]|nr:type II toxin-antitoxin system RelE/ParE family toxin [Chitinivibrionales bacterium]